jgi:hypothetical protein
VVVTPKEPSAFRATEAQELPVTPPAVSGKPLGSVSFASTPGRGTSSLPTRALAKASAAAVGGAPSVPRLRVTVAVLVVPPLPTYWNVTLPPAQAAGVYWKVPSAAKASPAGGVPTTAALTTDTSFARTSPWKGALQGTWKASSTAVGTTAEGRLPGAPATGTLAKVHALPSAHAAAVVQAERSAQAPLVAAAVAAPAWSTRRKACMPPSGWLSAERNRLRSKTGKVPGA